MGDHHGCPRLRQDPRGPSRSGGAPAGSVGGRAPAAHARGRGDHLPRRDRSRDGAGGLAVDGAPTRPRRSGPPGRARRGRRHRRARGPVRGAHRLDGQVPPAVHGGHGGGPACRAGHPARSAARPWAQRPTRRARGGAVPRPDRRSGRPPGRPPAAGSHRAPAAPGQRWPAPAHRAARRADRAGRGHRRHADRLAGGGGPHLLRPPRRPPEGVLPPAGRDGPPRQPRRARGHQRRLAGRGCPACLRTGPAQPRRGAVRRPLRHARPHPQPRPQPRRGDRRPGAGHVRDPAVGRAGHPVGQHERGGGRELAAGDGGDAPGDRGRLRRRADAAPRLPAGKQPVLVPVHRDAGPRGRRDPRVRAGQR